MFQFRPRLEDSRAPTINFNGPPQNRVSSIAAEQQTLLPPANLPRQKINTERETQKLQQSNERLTSLHSKLHQEAEKIRQWKTTTEIEIQRKDKKIEDAMQTIDSLRKSIIELQLQNESTSTKLQETKSLHEATVHKIDATRNMCNALKEHVVKIESDITKGESDRDDLKFTAKERTDQLQELMLKFQDIEITCAAKNDEVNKKLSTAESFHMRKCQDLKDDISKYKSQVEILSSSKDAQTKTIKSLQDELLVTKEKTILLTETLESQENEIKYLKRTVETQKNEINTKENAEQLCKTQYTCLQDKHESIITEKKELEKVLEEERKDKVLDHQANEKRMEDMKAQIKLLEEELLNSKSRFGETYEEVNVKKHEIENLKETIQLKKEENTKLHQELLLSQESLNNLQKELEEFNKKVCLQTEALSLLEKDLMEEKDRGREAESKINKTGKTLAESEREIDLLKKTNSLLTIANQDMREKNEETSRSLQEMESKMAILKQEINGIKTENESTLAKNMELENNLLQNTSLLEEAREKLKIMTEEQASNREKAHKLLEECDVLKDENERTRQEKNGLRDLLQQTENNLEALKEKLEEYNNTEKQKSENTNKQLATKMKRIETLDNKVKQQQTDIAEKKKNIKENQQEIKRLKSYIKEADEKKASYEEQVEIIQEQCNSLKQKIEELQQKLQRQEEIQQSTIADAMSSKQEMLKCKQDYEEQIKELSSALEHYKVDNEHIIEGKNKDISLLKDKISAKEDVEEELKQCKASMNPLEKKVQQVHNEKEEAYKVIAEKEAIINSMEYTISEMSNSMKALQEELAVTKHNIVQKKIVDRSNLTKMNPSNKKERHVSFVNNFGDDDHTTYMIHQSKTDTPLKHVSVANTCEYDANNDNVVTENKADTPNKNLTLTKEIIPNLRETPRIAASQRRLSPKNKDTNNTPHKYGSAISANNTPSSRKKTTLNIRQTPKLSSYDSYPALDEKAPVSNKQKSLFETKSRKSKETTVSPKRGPKASNYSSTFQITRIERKPREKVGMDKEMAQFASLFPNMNPMSPRTGPSKVDSSEKRASFKSKKFLKPKSQKVKDTSWFDADSTFGFNEG